ncbi:MAG: hypothetical protein GWN83_13440 [Gemmatimonadetes bacterium]|uniref:Soluble ligand binding domain-containing protein n=1 Tax=Candidatus Kutchimonas denitrificans TaxID=3056748 RepID=A0AAE4Z8V0_9BACT|nr:hypothetical protein [Gemmatimonadota bacterium]NIR75148.1 hypothetical protein [Candidatus Kutchimonas denitrificans]NIU52958.1 hypothetical protein [Gemmatimonadota bacterium]NIY44847.1 hypothetical protein [Gemmatimonadota bacterium]
MKRLFTILIALALFSPGHRLMAQSIAWDTDHVQASRQELQGMLQRFLGAVQSRAYSERLRSEARAASERITARLEEGDFRVGDRVLIDVEGQEELSDTFIVSADRSLEIPVVGTVALGGVLRSEIESQLIREIGLFIRDPVVHARALVRVAIFGEIARPGFHLLPPETPITEALMSVGGPTNDADLDKVHIRRGGDRMVLTAEEARVAIQTGRTLDELGLRAGDEIVVPKRSAFAPGEIGRTLLIVTTTITGLLFGLAQI